jgi:CubicO group peptidase (beta-lactamase class C family)
VAVLSIGLAPASASPGEADRIRAVIADPAGMTAPGCAVAIFRAGKTSEIVVAGAADTASGRPIGANTQFYAASVSKQFTAMAIMQLVVAGKVKLGDDIRAYLPEMPAYARPVTIAMLLRHSGGIRDSLALLFAAGRTDISAPTRQEALTLTLAQTGTNFEPGTRFDYTNGGYLLLSEIVERVAKEPFHAYVERAILKPLGMTRSFVMHGARPGEADLAHGYRVEGGKVASSDNYPLFGGSGGLITTVADLAKWDRDIDSGHVVWTPAITKLMLEPGVYNDGAPIRGRGFGYAGAEFLGPHWFNHGGASSGFKNIYARLPEKRLGIAMLCNRGEVDPNARADAIVTAIGEGLPPVSETLSPVRRIDGRYRSDDLRVIYAVASVPEGLKVDVLPVDGATARASFTYKRVDDGSFVYSGIRLSADEEKTGFLLEGGRLRLTFRRVD